MNATVITSGPGVSMATATASRNCLSLSQPYSCTTPPYRNGTIARPLPKTKAPAFAKNHRICPSTSGVAATTKHAGAERLSQAGGACATIATRPQVTKSQRISDSVPRRDHGHHREDQPLQLVLGHGQLGELVGGDGDDADHGGADAVEHRLHPRE